MSDYPDDSIQQIVDSDWWEEDDSKQLCRGALIRTYAQFFSEVPFEIVAARAEPTKHDEATLEVRPLHAGGRRSTAETLPVAGLPRLAGAESFLAHRGKRRPCLVIGTPSGPEVARSLVRGRASSLRHRFVLVAPYYGVKPEGREGCPPAFAERIRHAHYPQFFWDILPMTSGQESILRLDQIHPIGEHRQSFEHYGYRLGDAALKVFDEWLNWHLYDILGDSISFFHELVEEISNGD
ncbi:MAG: hypothetical protein HQ582_03050 [Planctomycetes bacterium]|nr:hypothetical protein [Planctomycetota bacterium]